MVKTVNVATMASSGRIAQNTTYLTIASIIQKIISFAYFAFLARSIGEVSLGKYTFALLFTSIFSIFMDFGLGPLFTREIAKNSEHVREYFRKLIGTKLTLMSLSLVVLFITIGLMYLFTDRVDSTDVLLVSIAAIIVLVDTTTFTFFTVLRAQKQMIWEAIGIVLYQSIIVAVGYTVLQNGLSLPFVLGALLIASSIQCVYMGTVVRRRTGVSFVPLWNRKEMITLIRLAAPFAVAGIIFRINGSTDVILLKLLAGDSYAGWYALAFKLTFALTVLPGAFATSYFPAMSQFVKEKSAQLAETFEVAWTYMVVLAFPICAGVLVLGDDIVLRVWGEAWEASIEPLWILMAALPFIFLNYPIGNLLNAADKQTLNMVNMGIALAVNIVLNVVLIPYYTFNGAAIAVVASSSILVALGLPWVYRIAQFQWTVIWNKTWRCSVATALMAFILYFVQESFPLLVSIGVGGGVFLLALISSGALTSSEWIRIVPRRLRRTIV